MSSDHEPVRSVSTPSVSTPSVSTPSVSTPSVSTPAVSTPAVSTPADPSQGARHQRVLHDLLHLPLWTAHDVDDAGRILAAGDEPGSLQLLEIAPDGTRTWLTDLPGRCRGRYVPGRRQVVVEHDDGGNEQLQLSLLDLDGPLPARLEDLRPLVADPDHMNALLEVRAGTLVYSTNRRNGVDMDVVLRDLHEAHEVHEVHGVDGDRAGARERTVYDGGGYVVSTHVSPTADAVAVTTLGMKPNSTVVTLVRDGGSRVLTDPEVVAHHSCLGFAAGSSQEVLLASDHARDHAALVRVGPESWRTLVADDAHDLGAWLAPDASAVVVGRVVDGAWGLAVHEPDGRLRCHVDLPDDGAPSVVWGAGADHFVAATSRPGDPGSLWRVDAHTGRADLLLDGTAALPAGLRLAEHPEVHRIPTPDGEQVPCFVYRPPVADPALAGACVVLVHGGPEGMSTRAFAAMTQVLCAAGLSVVVPNVRGSVGYGKRWYSLDDVELRLDSVADLGALHDWLPAVGLDRDRAVLWGGSYGGYMVLCGLTMQPERWAGGVDIVGISSLVTFLENTADYRRAVREREYGSLEHHRDFLLAASPMTHLDRLKAPLLLIHGANDPRVPLSEAEQIRDALAAKGIECVLKVYSDEGHGLAKRVNRLDAYAAALDFVLGLLRRPVG